ncbi:TPA: hypothetical protein ACXIOX_001990, partial [Neisseria meningitidis]
SVPTGLDSRFCGNDGGGVSVFADRFLWFFGCWIPAFAGMTAVGFLFLLIDSCGFSVAGFPLSRE